MPDTFAISLSLVCLATLIAVVLAKTGDDELPPRPDFDQEFGVDVAEPDFAWPERID